MFVNSTIRQLDIKIFGSTEYSMSVLNKQDIEQVPDFGAFLTERDGHFCCLLRVTYFLN